MSNINYIKEKWNHSGFQKYLKNTSWMFFSQIFSLAVAFFISAWLARYFGPENYGKFSYAIAFSGMFAFIVNMGVDSLLSKELVSNTAQKNELLGTGFVLKLLGAFSAISLVVVTSLIFIDDALIRLIVILYSFVFAFEPLNIIGTYFQSQVKSKINSIIRICALIVSASLKIGLILSGLGIIWLTAIFVVEAMVINILLIFSYFKNKESLKDWVFDFSLAKKMLFSSIFLILASGFNYFFMKIDQLMIGSLLGNLQVGIYAVAVRFVDIWYFIPVILTGSLFPALVNAKQDSSTKFRNRFKKLLLLMVSIGFLVGLISSMLSGLVINLLFGPGYIESVSIIRIHSWSAIGVFTGWAIYHLLLAQGKLVQIFIFYLASGILSLISNIILINNFGLKGAAVSAIISSTLIPSVYLLYYIKYNNSQLK